MSYFKFLQYFSSKSAFGNLLHSIPRAYFSQICAHKHKVLLMRPPFGAILSAPQISLVSMSMTVKSSVKVVHKIMNFSLPLALLYPQLCTIRGRGGSRGGLMGLKNASPFSESEKLFFGDFCHL